MFNLSGIQNELNFANTPPIRAIFCNTQGLQVNAISLAQLFTLENNLIPIISPVEYDVVTSQITKEKSLIFPVVYNITSSVETQFNAIVLVNNNDTFSIMRLQTSELQTVSPTKKIRLKLPNLKLIFK